MSISKREYLKVIRDLDLTLVEWVQRRHHRMKLKTPEGRVFSMTASVSPSGGYAAHNFRRDLERHIERFKEIQK